MLYFLHVSMFDGVPGSVLENKIPFFDGGVAPSVPPTMHSFEALQM